MLSICSLASAAYLVQPRMMADRPAKAVVEMPSVLKDWGCDEDLWGLVRSKQPLIKLAEEGNEAAARERIEMLRNSPSITGANAPMPAKLAELGMDESLWSSVRSKGGLIKLVEEGDEAAVKAKIAAISRAVAAEKERAPPTGGEAFELRKASRTARNSGAAQPLGEYKLEGSLPASLDAAAVASMMAKRVAAKKAKDFSVADLLQEELKGMGVQINDRARTYFAA